MKFPDRVLGTLPTNHLDQDLRIVRSLLKLTPCVSIPRYTSLFFESVSDHDKFERGQCLCLALRTHSSESKYLPLTWILWNLCLYKFLMISSHPIERKSGQVFCTNRIFLPNPCVIHPTQSPPPKRHFLSCGCTCDHCTAEKKKIRFSDPLIYHRSKSNSYCENRVKICYSLRIRNLILLFNYLQVCAT